MAIHVVVRYTFYYHVISCALARRDVWLRLAEAATSSACGRSNAIGLTSILDRGQFLLLKNCICGHFTIVVMICDFKKDTLINLARVVTGQRTQQSGPRSHCPA